jgi:nuclear pore complex protein Nup160
MAAMVPFYSYKETRLNFDSTTQDCTISIHLPAHGASSRSSKRAQNRSSVTEATFAEDEAQYRQKYLASAASIYHRQYHKSPRSFLWRVLEDGKVLSIQSADISSLKDAPDYNLTLRLIFQDAIQPGCIALSDSEEHDVLSVFVLSENKHLYTFTLRPDFFRKASSTEDNVQDWCKSHNSTAFSIKTVHRMVALSADELLLSTNDGGLLSLKRKPGSDGKLRGQR